MSYYGYPEEGENCRERGCAGKLAYVREGSCSCHINPPCGACTDAKLTCKVCGWVDDSPPETYKATEYPGLSQLVYKPRPLDKTKIDYRSEGHTHFSMIKKGVYPEGTTMEEVRKVVNGSFGGEFRHFGGGTFEFVAYTD